MKLIMMLSLKLHLCLLLFLCMSNLAIIICKAKNHQQGEYLYKLIQSKRSQKKPYSSQSHGNHHQELEGGVNDDDVKRYYDDFSKVIVDDDEEEYGNMEDDKVKGLPGQPYGVDFDQYAGYVTVDAKAGRALFYYFVESPHNSSTKPLVLWLNGGPGCSSLGYGAMQELGPFRVNSDGKTLHRNPYAWNNVANVIFIESPAGVGFSYSNTSSDYLKIGDKSTALDSYIFLLKWLQRFPHYKTRDFFITGESYGGHYVPQLAHIILSNNNHTLINLKGIAVGNGWIDDNLCSKGMYDYFWTHGLNSDETHASIERNCDFESGNLSSECNKYMNIGDVQVQNLNIYNIYAPICDDDDNGHATNYSSGNDFFFDPCSEDYTSSYLNLPQVQKALHANASKWYSCGSVGWTDSPTSILPIISRLISNGISIWIYSGDIDGRVPITSSRYSINSLKLPVEIAWRPWYSRNNEIGGYVVGYKGLTLITVRGAGHMVPTNQPHRALTMISSFLRGELPPQN